MVVAKLLIRPYFVGGVSQWKLKTRANLPMPRKFWRRKNIERKTHQPFLESSKKPKKLFWRCNISATYKFSCICLFHLWGGGAGLPYAILAASIKLEKHMWGTHEIKLWSNKNEHQSEIWNPTNLNPWIQGIWVLTFSRVHHPCCPWRCRKIWPFPHHSPSKTIVWRMCSTTDLGNLLWDSKPWFVWKCLRRILPS